MEATSSEEQRREREQGPATVEARGYRFEGGREEVLARVRALAEALRSGRIGRSVKEPLGLKTGATWLGRIYSAPRREDVRAEGRRWFLGVGSVVASVAFVVGLASHAPGGRLVGLLVAAVIVLAVALVYVLGEGEEAEREEPEPAFVYRDWSRRRGEVVQIDPRRPRIAAALLEGMDGEGIPVRLELDLVGPDASLRAGPCAPPRGWEHHPDHPNATWLHQSWLRLRAGDGSWELELADLLWRIEPIVRRDGWTATPWRYDEVWGGAFSLRLRCADRGEARARVEALRERWRPLLLESVEVRFEDPASLRLEARLAGGVALQAEHAGLLVPPYGEASGGEEDPVEADGERGGSSD